MAPNIRKDHRQPVEAEPLTAAQEILVTEAVRAHEVLTVLNRQWKAASNYRRECVANAIDAGADARHLATRMGLHRATIGTLYRQQRTMSEAQAEDAEGQAAG